MDTIKAFMAISKGQTSTDSVEFKRYIGVAPCYIKGVNPTKAEMEKIFGNSVDEEPKYISEVEVEDRQTGVKEKVPNVRISFITQPAIESVPPISVAMFLQKKFRYNKDKTKVQVIDKYGRTAWTTIEQAKNHEIPMYSNGPANLDKDFRPAYIGEEELTNFLIAYLNIPNVMKFNQNSKTWSLSDNPQDSECRLDHIEDYFKGDFRELKEAIALQPDNKVKIMFGVRTNNEGKQFQTAYTRMFLRNGSTLYNRLEEDLQSRKDAGAFSNTEFSTEEFKEYKVQSTPIVDNTLDDLPFGPSTETSPW